MDIRKGFLLSSVALLVIPLYWHQIIVEEDYWIPATLFFGWLFVAFLLMLRYPFLKVIHDNDGSEAVEDDRCSKIV
jgi:hypothetical protein